MQVLYLDVLFFLNTIMNLLIFKVAITVSNTKVKLSNLIIAAITSSLIYCMGLIIPILREIPMSIYQCFIPIGAIIYLFRCTTIRTFLKKFLVVNGVAWVMGGIAFNFYYLLSQWIHIEGMHVFIPIGAGFIILIITEIFYNFIRQSVIEPQYTYDLLLQNGGNSKSLVGYLDTGNTLYTLNHQPVMLVEYDQVMSIVSEEYKQLLESCSHGIILEKLIEYQKDIKIYLIPFTSVGCKESVLVGIPIQMIRLEKGSQETVIKDGVVGICYHNLFKDQRYQALIHPDLIR